MTTFHERQQEIVAAVALKAYHQPVLTSGLWFHHDIRDNFYNASYLFAAAVDLSVEVPFNREEARTRATDILLNVLILQNQDLDSEKYGHWPLNLHPIPSEASPHVLPVEIMGSLMLYFYSTYSKEFTVPLREAFRLAFQHIYYSNFYCQPLEHFIHHDAKFTATQLIYGQWFEDKKLLEEGHRRLKLTLEHVTRNGMPEYGCLPWFWHWIQAFTCAFALINDSMIKSDLGQMLDYLWKERALFYLKGAWVGAHSRGWPHDMPKDSNVLHDYVQFGDFVLPDDMPRIEYAGLLFYKAPEQVRRIALDHSQPMEVKKRTSKLVDNEVRQLHSYAYTTDRFAVGGMWERVKEFDNEQQRWVITMPLQSGGGGNQLYFFHPSEEYSVNDPRHQSEYAEVLYHTNTVISLYLIPDFVTDNIVGVLPKGVWIQEEKMLFGHVDEVYIAVYLMHAYHVQEKSGYKLVTSEGRTNGVVVEVLGCAEASQFGMGGIEQFAITMRSHSPSFLGGESGSLQARYTSLNQDHLSLTAYTECKAEVTINEVPLNFAEYEV